MRLRFIKVAQHNRFEFTPRYYSPEKEELEARKAVATSDEKLKNTDPEAYRKRISESFRNRSREQDRQSIIIRSLLVVIITGLLLLMYWFVMEWAAAAPK